MVEDREEPQQITPFLGRKIAFSNLNFSIEVVSSYSEDTLEVLANFGFGIYQNLLKAEKENNKEV